MSEDVEEKITDIWYLRDKPWESAFAIQQKRRNRNVRLEREATLLNNAAEADEEEEAHHEG